MGRYRLFPLLSQRASGGVGSELAVSPKSCLVTVGSLFGVGKKVAVKRRDDVRDLAYTR